MVLILGGAGAGKRSFARGLGYSDGEMSSRAEDACPVFVHLEQVLREDPTRAEGLLEPLCGKELVLCCEVGSGIIPLDPRERQAREAVGRLCILLAQRAEAVVRMVAGIPLPVKGSLPCRRC